MEAMHLDSNQPPPGRDRSHDQSHDHSHAHGHSHDHSHDDDSGHGHVHPSLAPSVLGWAMAATLVLVLAEILSGVLGRSVALLNDAVHNLSVGPAWALSGPARRGPRPPADSEKTYGYHRAGIL